MKKYLLLLSFALITLQLQAEERRTVYCSTTTSGYVSIDYGQPHLNKNWLVDENGKSIYFRSMIGVMNYMTERGWHYEGKITSVESETILDKFEIDSSTLLIFSKEITSSEQITEGLLTRYMLMEQQALK